MFVAICKPAILSLNDDHQGIILLLGVAYYDL
jgi:hypothetical protein